MRLDGAAAGRRIAGWLRPGHLARRVATIALATAVLALVASSDVLHAAFVDLFDAATRLVEAHRVAGPVAFVLFAAVSAMLAFFSSTALVPPALVAWGPLATLLLLWLGWVVGGVASYAAARYFGRPLMAFAASRRALVRWEERISHRTPFALVLLFQLAVPSEVPGFVLGLARYPLRRYLGALVLGELPFALGAVLLSESFLARRMPLLVGIGLAAAAGSFVAYRALHRRLAAAAAATAARDEKPGREAS